MSGRRILSLLLSLALSVVLIALLVRQVDPRILMRTLTGLSVPGLLLFAAISLAAAGLRAVRYRWLLGPVPIGAGAMLGTTLIRNALDDLLPARVGSLSYIVVLNKGLGLSFESAASSFVVALVFDFLTVAPFVAGAVLVIGVRSAGIPAGLLLALAAAYFLIMLIAAWKMIPLLEFGVRLYGRVLVLLRWSARPWAARSVDKLRLTVASLQTIRARRIAGRIFALSLLIRIGKYLSLYALLLSLLHGAGVGAARMSLAVMILGVTGAEMTSALPIKGLADFGTWESAWTLTFKLLGIDVGLAVATGLGVHLIANLWEYGLGLAAMAALLGPFRRRRRASDRKS